MIYRGRINNGVVVLEGGVCLPEGTPVKVEAPTADERPAGDDRLYRLGELAVPTGIPDLAVSIDHYLYGHPKAHDAQ